MKFVLLPADLERTEVDHIQSNADRNNQSGKHEALWFLVSHSGERHEKQPSDSLHDNPASGVAVTELSNQAEGANKSEQANDAIDSHHFGLLVLLRVSSDVENRAAEQKDRKNVD